LTARAPFPAPSISRTSGRSGVREEPSPDATSSTGSEPAPRLVEAVL
jgi:hypothetical protein